MTRLAGQLALEAPGLHLQRLELQVDSHAHPALTCFLRIGTLVLMLAQELLNKGAREPSPSLRAAVVDSAKQQVSGCKDVVLLAIVAKNFAAREGREEGRIPWKMISVCLFSLSRILITQSVPHSTMSL